LHVFRPGTPTGFVRRAGIVETWRRTHVALTIEPWRRLSRSARRSVEADAATLRLGDTGQPNVMRWID